MKPEYRFVPTDIRMEQGEDSPPRVMGLGIIYGKKSQNLGGQKYQFYEIIEPGAFAESIEVSTKKSARPIKSYFNHDPNQVIATTRSDPPLKLMDTTEGVAYEAEIPPTSYGKDLEVNLARKNVEGSSFSFTVSEEEWKEEKRDDLYITTRRVIKGEVFEMGPVTDPAYLQAPASLRSAGDVLEERQRKLAAEEADEAKKEEAKKEVSPEQTPFLRELEIDLIVLECE